MVEGWLFLQLTLNVPEVSMPKLSLCTVGILFGFLLWMALSIYICIIFKVFIHDRFSLFNWIYFLFVIVIKMKAKYV